MIPDFKLRDDVGRHGGAEATDGPVYAAIDLGTTNCRLLMARPGRDGPNVIDSFSRVVRLGEGLNQTGRLSEPAMHRAVSALRVCAKKLKATPIEGLRAVSTAACRKADNGDSFLKRVAAETGLKIETISPEEEGRLALKGCHFLVEPETNHALFFDIGGGSTQVVWMALGGPEGDARIEGLISVPFGVVGLSERLGVDCVDDQAFEELVAEIRDPLSGFEREHGIVETMAARKTQMIGASGTVTTLAALQLDLPRYERSVIDGATLNVDTVWRETSRLRNMDRAARRAIGSIGPQRADMIVAGCAILTAICRQWPALELKVADRGVREGILIDLMGADGHLDGSDV